MCDVAWAGRRTATNGKVPAIGSTVDVARATLSTRRTGTVPERTWIPNGPQRSLVR